MTELLKSWNTVSLSEVLETLETGVRPKGGVRHITEGFPSLGGEHINNEGGFDFENIKFIPTDFSSNLTRGRISKEDILIVKDGATTGKTAFVNDDFPYETAFINEHIFKCTISKRFGDPKYFFWYLFSPIGNREILKNFRGAAQGGIIRSFADNVLIPLPPVQEQNQIILKLDRVFTKLAATKFKLNKIPTYLGQLKQSVINNAVSGELTRQWRVKKNLPEWTEVKLIDVVVEKPRNGYSPKPADYPTNVKSLTLTATTKGKFDPSFYKYIDHEISHDSYLWLQNGDILIQRGNTLEYVGVSAIYKGGSKEFIYPDLMMKVRSNEKILTEYLYYSLSSDITRQYFRSNATGVSGSMPKINQETVSNTRILLPSLEEQQEIIKRTEALLLLIENIEGRYLHALAQLNNLKDVTLTQAFTGQLTKKWRNQNPNIQKLSIEQIPQIPRLIKKRNRPNTKKEELIMKQTKIISVLEAIERSSAPISAQELLINTGYPKDASTDEIEKFFIDIRTQLIAGKIRRERKNNEDFFERVISGKK